MSVIASFTGDGEKIDGLFADHSASVPAAFD
jgi:hypothetical protein